MTLEHYWSILAKRWKLILLCLIVMGAGTYTASKLLTPLYQASVLVQVSILSSNNQADYNSLLASDQLVQTESLLAVSDPILQEVASHYKGLTAQQLAREVTSSVKVNTQLLEIVVLDPSPRRAADLANDVAATLIAQQIQVTQQNNARSQQQIQQDLNNTESQISSITDQITQLQGQKGTAARVADLQAQRAGLQQHYNQWQTLLAQIELAEAQSGSFLHIAQSATPASTPVRPQVLLYTGGGLLTGLLLGLLLALLVERLDTRVRTPEAIQQLLSWTELTAIWKTDAAKAEGKTINPTGHNPNVEPYRILRTNIGFSNVDKPLHSLLVTSGLPEEGKSTIAANLAIFMAKSGKKTLLIDADLRRPSLHEKFQLPSDKAGLSNAILSYAQHAAHHNSAVQEEMPPFSFEPYMHAVDIPNLRVMPSGPLPPNPPELLDSKALERLLLRISASDIDMLIIDTPPLLGLSDTVILAPKVDGAIVVVDVTGAKRGNLQHIKGRLSKSGIRVLGYVVNKQRLRRQDSYSYYYSYETKKQSKADQKKQREAQPEATQAQTAAFFDSALLSLDISTPVEASPSSSSDSSRPEIAHQNHQQQD